MAGPLSRFLKLRVVPPLAAGLLRLLSRTWRLHLVVSPAVVEAVAAGEPLVGAFFHGRQACLLRPGIGPALGPWTILCSSSLDGEMQHRILTRLGFATVRGSSRRGGARALVALARVLRRGPVPRVTIAVDGGKPAYRSRPGVIALAGSAPARIAAVGACARPAVIIPGTWDEYLLPLPFARVVLVMPPPVAVPAGLQGPRLVAWLRALDRFLARCHRRADRLARSRRRFSYPAEATS